MAMQDRREDESTASFPGGTLWRVPVGDAETSAAYYPAAPGPARGLFICGPSAGADMADRGLLRITERMRATGLAVVAFNFLYRQEGRRRPDPMPELQRCFSAVAGVARERSPGGFLLIGGRSMGGRVASMMAADAYPCDGLLLFAYPLHPAGQPERLRAAHLPRITVPTLCFNGTRDRLCTRDLMETAVAPLGRRWTMHWLEGADHGFHVLRSSGRGEGELLAEVARATQAWLDGLEIAG